MDIRSETVQGFLSRVGRAKFKDELALQDNLISRAVVTGVMPASWYADVRDWCAVYGHAVPRDELFRFRKPINLELIDAD